MIILQNAKLIHWTGSSLPVIYNGEIINFGSLRDDLGRSCFQSLTEKLQGRLFNDRDFHLVWNRYEINLLLKKFMSGKYKARDSSLPHFVSFSVINWIDALTRIEYKEIIVESLKYCIQEKGLILNAWVIMSNHVHLILQAKEGCTISWILRDLKKYTSKKIISAIEKNPRESRKEWMLWMFARAGKRNSNNKIYQFWQQENHPVELTSNYIMDQRLEYLHENPVKAGIVYEPQEYVYSSATDYYTERSGKIDINLIE
jgi:REP element-mobilizing transposase RayT